MVKIHNPDLNENAVKRKPLLPFGGQLDVHGNYLDTLLALDSLYSFPEFILELSLGAVQPYHVGSIYNFSRWYLKMCSCSNI